MRIELGIISKTLGNIRFWIFFFFVVRLVGITNPPVETTHNWRQSNVTMVARNFYETDANIFYPRIDVGGEKSGITGMEFPIFNYTIYLTANLFGYQHWYGRLINLLISSIGLLFFFKLIAKYFDPKIAFNATIVLICSVWFSYARKIMPDTFSMSFLLMGIYYGSNYLDKKQSLKNILLYSIFIALGSLSKLPSAFCLVLFALFIFNKNIKVTPKIIFIIISTISLFPTLVWYFYWSPHLVQEFGLWYYFMGKSLTIGAAEIIGNLSETAERFYESALKYIGFALFCVGLFIAIYKKHKRLILVFGLSFLAFIFVVLKAGETFPKHAYYIVPFAPIMALVCGYGVAQIKNKKIGLILLIAIALEGILNQRTDFFIRPEQTAVLHLEKDLDQFSNRTDLILINSGHYPTPMYFAHRKGWVADNRHIKEKKYLEKLKKKGLKYIVIMKNSFGSDLPLNYNLLLNNEDYRIYLAFSN